MPRRRARHYLVAVPLIMLLLGALASQPGTSLAQAPFLQIAQIQGAAHLSPVAGQVVETEGIVTATRAAAS